jgi:hypothetical protein
VTEQTTPEVPHADLIARLRREARSDTQWLHLAADALAALAALGNTVPREQYEEAVHTTNVQQIAMRRLSADRDEARSERDALAHERTLVPHDPWCPGPNQPCDPACWKATAPTVSLALHDAEVWDEGAAAVSPHAGAYLRAIQVGNPYRAAAIREGAGQ